MLGRRKVSREAGIQHGTTSQGKMQSPAMEELQTLESGRLSTRGGERRGREGEDGHERKDSSGETASERTVLRNFHYSLLQVQLFPYETRNS